MGTAHKNISDGLPDMTAIENIAAAISVPLPKTLLRFSTAGSVDDGKSTFIGRLLLDTGNLYNDHLANLEAKAQAAGDKRLPLALVTDGLKAEREQGITIDVAYRYFSTPKRRFILADSPGHEQYTRNMATGASHVDLTVILVDAKRGITLQTKRHAFIAALLGVPRLLVAVNKMDMVDYAEARYEEIKSEFTEFSGKLGVREIRFMPVVAVDGDNIVHRSAKFDWYHGETVLEYLESVYTAGDQNHVDFRFPVQYVIRGEDRHRAYAGTVESGSVRVGEEVVVLPGNHSATITEIHSASTGGLVAEIPEALAGSAVTISLSREVDISRGSMICRRNNVPRIASSFEAMIVWLDDTALADTRKLFLRHTSREVRADVRQITYAIDVSTLSRTPADNLKANDIARVTVRTHQPIFVDSYQRNRGTGSFILVDAVTSRTVAAGMILDRSSAVPGRDSGDELSVDDTLHRAESLVTAGERRIKWNTPPATIWLTGLSGSGKSTIAQAVERQMFDRGQVVVRLDGDMLRHGLCKDLGFSEKDRSENIRRASAMAKILNESGICVICSFVSPYAGDRAMAAETIGRDRFAEVYIRASVEECEQRDPHGLYARARKGEIENFTGVSAPYEVPLTPRLVLDTQADAVDTCAARLIELIDTAFDKLV